MGSSLTAKERKKRKGGGLLEDSVVKDSLTTATVHRMGAGLGNSSLIIHYSSFAAGAVIRKNLEGLGYGE